MKPDIPIILLVLCCALLGAMGQIFFKMSSKNFSLEPISLIKNYNFVIGATLYAISAILFVYSLKFGDLSILYPLIATSYIWVGILSQLILREPFSPFKWFGVVLILLGIMVIVR